MNALRILGLVLLLAGVGCFAGFRFQMGKVRAAQTEASKYAVWKNQQERDLLAAARAREAAERLKARNWFLSGMASGVLGMGAVGASLVFRRRGVEG